MAGLGIIFLFTFCCRETLMQVLLEPGYLLPTTEQIAALTIKERGLSE